MDNALINIFDTSEKSDEYAADKLNRCDNDYAQYEMREKILSKYQKVVARDVYSFAFPEGFLQVCDEIDSENGKGNAIRMDIVEKWSVDENGNKQCSQVGMQTVITEDLNFLLVKPKKVQNYKIIMSNTNLNSYFGNRRLKEKIDKIFGLIIEVDGVVKDSQMIHLINEIDAEKIPVPNFLINSGHGLHFYYVLDEPIFFHERSYAVYPVITNLLNALKDLVWTPQVSDLKPETMDLNKGYTIIGTKNRKNPNLIVTAYAINPVKCSLSYLRIFINKPADDLDYDITFPPCSKVTKEEAKKLYPHWAVQKFPEEFPEEERKQLLAEIEQKKLIPKKKKCNEGGSISVCNSKIYQWFLKLISDPKNLRHGNRYHCMLGLAIYGVKCGIDKGQVEQDLKKLLPVFNSVNKNREDLQFLMNESDIQNALQVYKNKDAHRYTYDWIMNLTGIEYEKKTKRREIPLNQEEHLKLARQKCEEMHPDGSWRGYSGGETKQKILEFIKKNPQADFKECIKYCECSPPSIYKYWEECRSELGLDIKKRISNAEKIKSYRQLNPNARKIDCIRDLGLSKKTVYNYWDKE